MKKFILKSGLQLDNAIDYIKTLVCDGKTEVVIREHKDTRSLAQNAKFHKMCQDIANSGIKWDGEVRDEYEWKVFLVSGHSIVEKRDPKLARGLEGELVSLRESTSKMNKERLSSLIEYVYAWGINHEVKFSADYQEVK